ncbi:putative TspO/MBR-related protein precursor [Pilimelia anulata]|uniref:Putative TspO/MBR-related protein n=1 Tax=Pilimelia anulata TaxID=53371 RepID=A0A8J3F9K5_9ACTN|nr:TspO/MBR family protein [Pilimelia anulata]GGJ94098.1 putative TspO/MBR-related protein precursor [Pilimelia anulata]
MSALATRAHRGPALGALAVFAAACAAVALLGGLASADAGVEYAALRRPGWAPPSWLFGPVWTVLYAMIAVAGWRAWRAAGAGPHLWPYGVQLALNAAWTPVFFGANAYGPAIAVIALLWLAIGATVRAFRPVDRWAALLLLPYWAWVTFAAGLNVAIWWLNR